MNMVMDLGWAIEQTESSPINTRSTYSEQLNKNGLGWAEILT